MGFNSCIEDVVNKFQFEGRLVSSNCNECGHINDTFVVKFMNDYGEKNKYILQRINTNVFNQPENVMDNITNITNHIAKKVISEGGNPLRETLTLVYANNGKSYYKTENGDFFRSYLFIDGAKTYQKVEKPIHMYTCGRTLGKFQKQLSDFPVDNLHETIKDFHNTKKRYDTFLKAVMDDPKGRVKDVQEEINFLVTRCNEMGILVEKIENGMLPLRVTHNDTKFNNIMIDNETEEGIAVIDLDTVMPGLLLYDFGDSIRSGATTALEDEADLEKVNFDIELYENYVRGYLEEIKNIITEEEIKYLAFSAKLITMECGMRFLTDYINGDVYFKITRENHNLDRARNQFKLVLDMEEQMDKMREIVEKYL